MAYNFLLFPQDSALLSIGDSWGVVGDNMSLRSRRPKMYAYWLGLEMSGRCRWLPTTGVETTDCLGSNLAVSGQDTTEIAARAANITASNLDVVFCMSFENDGSSVTAQTMIANWQTILTSLSQSKRVYMIASGVTRTVYESTTVRNRNIAVNNWMATASSTFPNVKYIPDSVAWNDIILHNGAGGAGLDSYDGVHMNLQGAKKFASNLWRYIKDEFECGDAYTANPYATNLYPSDFSGAGGTLSNATGIVATGLALTNTTGATVFASKGMLNGCESQIITLSGTATTDVVVKLRESCPNIFAEGDSLDGWGRIKISAADGVSAPVGLKSLGFEGGGGRHMFLSQYHDTAEGHWTTPFEGIFRIQPDFFTGGSTLFYTDLSICPLITSGIDIRIEIADVRIYNMTQEGF